MTGWVPRQRRPYRDRCHVCVDGPYLPPVAVEVDGDRVIADYLCGCGRVWSTGWQRDPNHERWPA